VVMDVVGPKRRHPTVDKNSRAPTQGAAQQWQISGHVTS